MTPRSLTLKAFLAALSILVAIGFATLAHADDDDGLYEVALIDTTIAAFGETESVGNPALSGRAVAAITAAWDQATVEVQMKRDVPLQLGAIDNAGYRVLYAIWTDVIASAL